jgi:hypothetical protein
MSRATTTPGAAPAASHPAAARFHEASLVFNFVIHAVAMVSMALLLLPAMPGGGGVSEDLARVTYIATHPWTFRLGWFPWQVTALADLVLGVALLWTRWVPRKPALITVGLTLLAVVPDQVGQVLWMTRGVDLAAAAVRGGGLAAYLAFERQVFTMVGALGAIGYLLAALGWTWCFMAAGTWNRRLTRLSAATWGTFAMALIIYFLPARLGVGPAWFSFLNAVAFVLLLVWLAEVTDRVVARTRPQAAHGRYAPWRHPGPWPLARAANWVANSYFARALAEWLPTPPLVSDIRDVLYVNYLVPADRVQDLVPPELELQRVGFRRNEALVTVLTYRHGHFGPRLLGRLRRHLPSPIQSNWRIYVFDPRTGKRGVYFVSTAISSTAHALGGRLLSEGVPMHVPRRAELARDASGTVHVSIDPGDGTAPDLKATLRPSLDPALPPRWAEYFTSFRGFLEYCVPQDRAMSFQPWYDRVARQEIELGIPLESCRRMEGRVESQAARAIVGDAEPVCFYIPAVTFRFAGEEYDPRTVVNAAGGRPPRASEAPPARHAPAAL